MTETIKGLSARTRYIVVLICGLLIAVSLGIISGLLRNHFGYMNLSIVLVFIGLAIALFIRKIGHSVKLRYAVTSVLLTLLAIVLSDVVAAYGFESILDITAYADLFSFALYEDLASIIWLAFRGLSLYVSYIYSRIV